MGDFHPSDSGPCLTLEKLAMKKSLIALAVLAASGAAFAQSTATISGSFRIGYHADANGVKSIYDDQSSGNTINFAVTEDLGGGLKFVGKTQLRYRPYNGDNTNTTGVASTPAKAGTTATDALFHLANIGLTGGFGTVEFGRIGFDQMWGYNPFGSNGAHVNVSGTGGATEDGQWRYTTPTFVPGLKVSFGGAQKANTASTVGDSSQFLIAYANGPLSASVVSEEVSSGTKYTAFGASYDLGVAKVMMISATDKNTAGTKTADGQSFSVTAPMGAVLLKAGMLNDKMAANKDKTSFGVDYALSKRTTLEANTYKVKGDAKQSYWMGVRHAF